MLLPPPAQQAGGTGGSAGEAEGGWWPRADVAVCANVIMSRNPQTRHVMLENLSRSLRPGGALLLVVPAAESVEIVRRRQGDWLAACAEHGLQAAEAIPEDELREHQEEGGGRGGGVYSRAGVLQKHWRREELIGALTAAGVGLQLESLEQVEYPWWTEFGDGGSSSSSSSSSSGGGCSCSSGVWESLGSPYPFDWLALCTSPLPSPSGDAVAAGGANNDHAHGHGHGHGGKVAAAGARNPFSNHTSRRQRYTQNT
eukprot:COSAG06_NODE_997_length_11148_cov_5.400489_4_plen_256_part_00